MAPSGSGAAPSSGSAAAEPSSSLHLSGRVTKENQHVKMGSFHTLDLEGAFLSFSLYTISPPPLLPLRSNNWRALPFETLLD